MRLLLAISASFMPSHIHDIKHEIRDRHAVFGGQRVWVSWALLKVLIFFC